MTTTTTTTTPSPEAEALPTLPVVEHHYQWNDDPGRWLPVSGLDNLLWLMANPLLTVRALTPLTPAEAAIVALRDDRDSWCQQASARAEDAVRFAAERDALRAEVAELRKERDESMVRLDTALATCNDWFKANGPGGWIDELRRRAALLGDGGTL